MKAYTMTGKQEKKGEDKGINLRMIGEVKASKFANVRDEE